MRFSVSICLAMLALPVGAQELALAGALRGESDVTPAGSVRLPEKPWEPGAVPALAEGAIARQVLRLPNSSHTTLQLIDPVRSEFESQGFTQVFSCADAACGGFDFRFQLDLIGEPHMHVDLGDFRYVLMRHPTADPHTVSVVASRSQDAGYLHITRVGVAEMSVPKPDVSEQPAETQIEDLIVALTTNGHVVLGDLEFTTGSADLGAGPFVSLASLADWLTENPGAKVVLVGHTDAVGSLDGNTALSKRRAAAVEARLIELQVGQEQLQSAGAGFLAPVGSNLSEDGRSANRRVEAVLLSLN